MEEKDKNNSLEEKKISLELIIEKAKGFISGDISEEEMATFGGEMMIRSYIPILEKMGLIMAILNQHIYSDVEVQEIKTVEMYKNIFFYIMLSGYANVDCSDRDLITYSNYDLLYPIYAPFILSYCREDYQLIIDMLKDSINFYSIKDMSDGLNGINETALKEATKANKDLMKELGENKDLIHELKELAELNDPTTKKMVETIKRASLNGEMKAKEKAGN